MIENFKKHIDTTIKKELKAIGATIEESNFPTVTEGRNSQLDYSKWLEKLLDQKIDYCFPVRKEQLYLFDLLSVDVLYKQSFSDLCRVDHPALDELFRLLEVSEESIKNIINKVKKFNSNYLDYFELFRDDICHESFSTVSVVKKIDQLSVDSSQGALVTHPVKMSNPSCKFPRVVATANSRCDGFLRTGNAVAEIDMHINATKLKVYKFLMLRVGSETILDLIRGERSSDLASVFLVEETKAAEWIKNFSQCIGSGDVNTHPLVKQVFYPVSGGYHQLSILSPSGLIFSLKNRVDLLNDRCSESYLGKKNRKNNKHFEKGFSTVVDLTVTRHGGDHPKNISALNNKYQKYYLLKSSPPELKKRDIKLPTRNFFLQTISYYHCKDIFYKLHKLYENSKNNMKIRSDRDACYQLVVDRIISKMWQVRTSISSLNHFDLSQLNHEQKIWLLEENIEKRESEDEWLEVITKGISKFIFQGYEKTLGKRHIKLADGEFDHITSVVRKNKEALR